MNKLKKLSLLYYIFTNFNTTNMKTQIYIFLFFNLCLRFVNNFIGT